MSRYILRYTGPRQSPPAADVAAVRRAGALVLDESGRMLLVDASKELVDRVTSSLGGWVAAPERILPRPRTVPVVSRAQRH